MAEVQESPGTVLDGPGVTILDTRSMDWEESDYLPKALRKVLARDADGDPIIMMRWLTNARTDTPSSEPGGYHLAREQYFSLGGERPHWEKEPGSSHELYNYKEGDWLDRDVGSVHGGGVRGAVPVKWLGWLIHGADPYVGVRESVELTDELPAPGRKRQELPEIENLGEIEQPAAAFAVDKPGPGGRRVIVSRELLWEPHPVLPTAHLKPLSTNRRGDPTVTIEAFGPGAYPAPELPYRVSHRFHDFTYVLLGELKVIEYSGPDDFKGRPILLREGYFVARRPYSVYGFDDDMSVTGCTLLHFRVREDAVLIKEQDKHPRWSRTLNVEKRDMELPKSGNLSKPFATEADRQQLLADRAAEGYW